MQKRNVIKILLDNERVNNYTKLLLYLNMMDHFSDYYIPNKKLMNYLKCNKNRIIVLLKQLKKDNIINVFYRGRKRYFVFIANSNEDNKNDIDEKRPDVFDYNWLEDED